ncbi:MAG: sulfate/molybdate ABC transporter ATP-binding protein [Firmicutes bacterium]|nr:sulfate/molybdate ABC transporter ATP-binding protein [Bacillota bacterium]
MTIEVDIEKNFGDFRLQTCFTAGEEIVGLLGASGCGKTMTLKCIAGIERPDRGKITLNGRTLFDWEQHIDLPPQERRTGLLFQDYALFPTMTVYENIRTGTCREKDRALCHRLTEDMMERMGLAHLADHYPNQLSGGQKQRTALARMLVSKPDILLLDEPFSALDHHLRFRLEQEVLGILHDFGKTAILVSHHMEETYRLADTIAVMGMGTIEAMGTKADIYQNPGTRNGALLTGCHNLSPIEILGDHRVYATHWNMELTVGNIPEGATLVGIRMKDIKLEPERQGVPCIVERALENPEGWMLLIRPEGGKEGVLLNCYVEKAQWTALKGPEVYISLPPESIMLLKER